MQTVEEQVVYSLTRPRWLDSVSLALQELANRVFLLNDTARAAKDFLNGVWLAHPLHPTVTDLPVGAWTAAVALDGLEATTGRRMEPATTTAMALGTAGGILSALSGLADWSDTGGTSRRLGLIHATANSIALLLFGASLWRRVTARGRRASLLSNVGWLTMVVGAYLGGELSFRLGTQVDRNAWAHRPTEFVPVMREEDLPTDKPVRAEAEGVPLMLVRHQGAIHALNDICSHQGCSLSGGGLVGGTIVCPCHGSTYRLDDGTVVHGPSPYRQPHYNVRVRDGQIEVQAARV